jgi:membrane protease subunit (stomatin/prohibitin family)
MYHYPGNDIMNGSLLTVESNHFCVLKSRGAILNVYETGQYPVETPQRPPPRTRSSSSPTCRTRGTC